MENRGKLLALYLMFGTGRCLNRVGLDCQHNQQNDHSGCTNGSGDLKQESTRA